MVKIERNLASLKESYDLIVIGGGITGISVAREAALRGISVCLIEKGDFSSATSAATSKLIHGGLRYLENYEFSLVRESLRERRLLGAAIPHLCRPLPIILPIYSYSKPNRLIMDLGLRTYDLLAFDKNRGLPEELRMPGARWLSRSEVMRRMPLLQSKDLKGGFLYYDYESISPDRIALAFLKSAVSCGAVTLNHTEVESFQIDQQNDKRRVTGVEIRDKLTNKKFKLNGKLCINATGPWMDLLLQKLDDKPAQTLQRSQGIHLLTRSLTGETALLFRNREGRHFFIIPWQGLSLIGPTDTPFLDHPDELTPKNFDVQQLLEDLNGALQHEKLSLDDVHHVLIGLRPLIFSGKSTYRASRRSEIYDHAEQNISGLISVAGGKWTTSRQLGETLIQKALRKEELSGVISQEKSSRLLPLHGSSGFADSPEVIYEQIRDLKEANDKSEDLLRHLATYYGKDAKEVLSIAASNRNYAAEIPRPKLLVNSAPTEILAQVVYAIEAESARTLEDIFQRRLCLGAMGHPGFAAIDAVATIAAKLLKWKPAERKAQIESLEKSYQSYQSYRPAVSKKSKKSKITKKSPESDARKKGR